MASMLRLPAVLLPPQAGRGRGELCSQAGRLSAPPPAPGAGTGTCSLFPDFLFAVSLSFSRNSLATASGPPALKRGRTGVVGAWPLPALKPVALQPVELKVP